MEYSLTHQSLVPHLYVNELERYCSRIWLVANLAPTIIQNNAGLLSIGTIGSQFKGFLIEIEKLFFRGNASEYIVREWR